MRDSNVFRHCMLILIISTLLGCTSEVDQRPNINPTNEPDAPIKTETVTAIATAISRTPPESTATPIVPLPTNTVQVLALTSTPVSSQSEETTQVKVCSSAPTVYDFRSIFNIQLMTELRFLDDEMLFVEGWNTETELISGFFELKTESAEFESREWPQLSDPCTSNCSFDIIAQSPNSQWQLLLVKGSPDNADGIWLVSKNNQTHLVNFIPVRSKWQWSDDGTLLWFEHNKVEFGIQTIIVHLDTEPIVHYSEASQDNPLDRTWYFVAFSPKDNTALAMQNPRQFESSFSDGQLYFFDFNQAIFQQSSVESIPNLVKVEWNQPTESYLLIFSYEDRIELVDRETGSTIKLLLNTFDDLLPEVALQHNIPFSLHALSMSGTSLAITLGDGRVFVFECQAVPNP